MLKRNLSDYENYDVLKIRWSIGQLINIVEVELYTFFTCILNISKHRDDHFKKILKIHFFIHVHY